MARIDVLADASTCLKWFHAEGEAEVHEARELLARYRERQIGLFALDLTMYEVGNALLRGRGVPADAVTVVLDVLGELVPRWIPRPVEWARAVELSRTHGLTLYDAAYAAVAERRKAALATMDRDLLETRLGNRPSEVLATLP
jgi:predicted nucleic acid-binding protein